MSKPDRPASHFGDDDMTRLAGWDALADDLFGLNVRGFRSMAAAVASPAAFGQAARDPDWTGRFTPTIRLAFTLIAITVGLRFLWGGDSSALFDMMRLQLVPLEGQLAGRDLDTATRDILTNWLLVFPVTYFALHFPASFFLRVWGKATPAPIRIRLYFLCLIPALLTGVALSALYGVLDTQMLLRSQNALLVALGVLYIVTCARVIGPRPSAAGRAWRTVLAAGVMLTIDLLVSAVGFLVATTLLYASPV